VFSAFLFSYAETVRYFLHARCSGFLPFFFFPPLLQLFTSAVTKHGHLVSKPKNNTTGLGFFPSAPTQRFLYCPFLLFFFFLSCVFFLTLHTDPMFLPYGFRTTRTPPSKSSFFGTRRAFRIFSTLSSASPSPRKRTFPFSFL